MTGAVQGLVASLGRGLAALELPATIDFSESGTTPGDSVTTQYVSKGVTFTGSNMIVSSAADPMAAWYNDSISDPAGSSVDILMGDGVAVTLTISPLFVGSTMSFSYAANSKSFTITRNRGGSLTTLFFSPTGTATTWVYNFIVSIQPNDQIIFNYTNNVQSIYWIDKILLA